MFSRTIGPCWAVEEKQSSALNSMTETQVLENPQRILTECCHRSGAWWRFNLKFNQPMEFMSFYSISFCSRIFQSMPFFCCSSCFHFYQITSCLILRNCSLLQNQFFYNETGFSFLNKETKQEQFQAVVSCKGHSKFAMKS